MNKKLIVTLLSGVVTVILITLLVTNSMNKDQKLKIEINEEPVTEEVVDTTLPAGDEAPVVVDDSLSVYTFLQGPKSWKRKIDWSGKWGNTMMDGGSFGGFGCGLCCIANIYSTFSPYEASPIDAYKFAKKQDGYYGGSAIDWGPLLKTIHKAGFPAHLRKKPKTYNEFKQRVQAAKCCIMLVSSNNDSSYWKNTPGHYVTTFLYNEEDETIFLGDSGDPKHNRQRVSLKKIYKALKTISAYQFLTVGSYDEQRDTFKNTKTTGKFVRPEYIQQVIKD